MLERNLVKKQEELDLKKYDQSFLAHCDLAGKMEHCKGCLFRTAFPSCDLNHETRQKYCVCARNAFRLEEEKNVIREPFDKQNTETRRRTTKKCKTKSSDLQNV